MLLFLRTLPFFVSVVSASHAIRFFNYCGSGTPTIFTHGKRTSVNSRTTYSSNNDDDGGIHTFLEQGSCGNDGVKCTTVGVDLTIPEASLSRTGKYSVPLSLQYSCANGSIYFAQCYSSDCAPTPISCDSFNSDLIITFCPLGFPSLIEPNDSSPSSTLRRKLIAPIVIIIILVIALVGTILFLRRKNRRVRMDTVEARPRILVSRGSNPPFLRRPERASILTVPSYQSTRVASTINKELWEDFKSGSYFVKLYPTESEMSVFED
ncbi:hypothetical protein ARMGADRAFT_1082186 [Armillaria gallica]|uniref:Uncharacterized protein n=1 Tax=Armillaria gallica TaxID=47427 RepID=A0A2H3D6T3_ARMGA|nr:hypothetical protein ARMGADRAFT_1082186 [Armillaria gallica]